MYYIVAGGQRGWLFFNATVYNIKGAVHKIQLIRLQEKQILPCTELAASSRVQSDVTVPSVCALRLLVYLAGQLCVYENLLFLPPFGTVSPLPLLTLCK